MFKKLPAPITIIFIIIMLAAGLTWLMPAGRYQTLVYDEADGCFLLQQQAGSTKLAASQVTLDSLGVKARVESFVQGDIRKPVAVPGTYQPLPQARQGVLAVLQAPIKGLYDTMDIVLFVLIIGGFMGVFNTTGALNDGINWLAMRLQGRESWMIVILFVLFSLGGASYGMGEEALVFYPLLLPLLRRAGYDNLVAAAIIFGGTHLGCVASFSNPFSTIIASNLAGTNWASMVAIRVGIWAVVCALSLWYVLRYARRVRLHPHTSLVVRYPAAMPAAQPQGPAEAGNSVLHLSWRSVVLIALFLASFVVMVAGVLWWGWWLLEMSTLFLAAAILIGFIHRIPNAEFIHRFVKGAEELLSVSLIIGVARGVTVVLNDGQISDSILYYSAEAIKGVPPQFLVVMLFFTFMVLSFFISSTSGLAVLSIPILASVAMMAGVSGGSTVSAYVLGAGISQLWVPTGLALPSLALANVSFKAWVKFMWPLLALLALLSMLFLIVTIGRLP